MKTDAHRPRAARIAAVLVAAVAAGCATADRADEPAGAGCTVTGVRVVGQPRPASGGGFDRRWPADPAREARERMARGDHRFRVWMDDPDSGRAYFPGLTSADATRLARTADVVVEVIDDAEIFPVERDPYSRRAQLAAQFSAMARFNQALFRELDRRGRIAPPTGG